MPSMMAIVSKAVFEKHARGKAVGDTWATARYVSQNKQLASLAGGDLYLVTVRPGDVLWLVAVLEQPRFDTTQWTARANTQPIRDISALKTKLRFANGQGLPAQPGRLGMSLQTPRVLVADDLALLCMPVALEALEDLDALDDEAEDDDGDPTPPVSSTDTLARALDELRAGHAGAALELLVEAWGNAPHPRLAELIHQLSAEVRTPPLANLRGKTAAARAAWDERAAAAGAVDVPALLEGLCDVTSGDAAERLEIVARWLPDPRVEAALVDVLRDAPYRATSTKRFWTKLFPLLHEVRDPAQLARIAAIDFAGVAVTMADWLRGKHAKLIAALGQIRQDRPAPAIFDELAAVIDGQRAVGSADRADIEHLFRSVYDAPADDAPRIVLADALIERDDPRGELISVQLRLAQDPTDRALETRARELLDAHARGWLGELAPILMADVRFERGFLVACKVDNEHLDRVRNLVGHPAWSTVKSIEGSALIALDPVMRSLERLVFRSTNALRHEGLPHAWRDLLVDTPRGIVELQYESLSTEQQWLDTVEGRRQVEVSDQSEIDALCACAALPALRRLALRDDPVLYAAKLWRAPVLARLEQLAFLYDRNHRFATQRSSPLADFKQFLETARVPTLRFEIGSAHETELVLERGGHGYERAHMTFGPAMRSTWSASLVDEAIKMLDALPALRALRVTTRKHTEPQQVARLRAAAIQMNLDCVIDA